MNTIVQAKQQSIQAEDYCSQQQYSGGDEIDLRKLAAELWLGKWRIALITGLFLIGSVIYALSLPNEYKAVAMVAPANSSSGGGLNGLAGQLGGLASIAGVSFGSGDSSEDQIAMEIMKTWGFVDEFIKKHDLAVPIFAAKGWNQSKRELLIDPSVYDADANKWTRKPPKGKTIEPTSWELYEKFKENLSVSKNKDSGLINIGYTHVSPDYAKRITNLLIDDVNFLMKERALNEATQNISYLTEQIDKTSLSDMQNIFYSLIEDQTKTKMLAEVGDQYVFKSISKALAPEEKIKPSRLMIVILFSMIGFLLSCLYVLFRK